MGTVKLRSKFEFALAEGFPWMCWCGSIPLDLIFWKRGLVFFWTEWCDAILFPCLDLLPTKVPEGGSFEVFCFVFCLMVLIVLWVGFIWLDFTVLSVLIWAERRQWILTARFFLSYFIWFWCGCHLASFDWIDPGFRPALKRIVPRTQLRARGEKRLLLYTQQAFTQRSFTHKWFYTEQAFSQSKLLHREAFTHRSFCAQQAFAHSKLVHKEAATQDAPKWRKTAAKAHFTIIVQPLQYDLRLSVAASITYRRSHSTAICEHWVAKIKNYAQRLHTLQLQNRISTSKRKKGDLIETLFKRNFKRKIILAKKQKHLLPKHQWPPWCSHCIQYYLRLSIAKRNQ